MFDTGLPSSHAADAWLHPPGTVCASEYPLPAVTFVKVRLLDSVPSGSSSSEKVTGGRPPAGYEKACGAAGCAAGTRPIWPVAGVGGPGGAGPGGTGPPPLGFELTSTRRSRTRGFLVPFLELLRADFGSLSLSVLPAALRTTDSLSLTALLPTMSDALLMSAAAMFFSLNWTEAPFWLAGAIVRVAAIADPPQNARHITPAAIPRDSRNCR